MKDVYEDINIGFKAISEYDPEPQKPKTPIPTRDLIVAIFIIIAIIAIMLYTYVNIDVIKEEVNKALTTAFGEEEKEIIRTTLILFLSVGGIKIGTRLLNAEIKG